ncbi:MAG TPA: phenylalanine--tRNA ligase subunit alpha, partial [Firmicutes bacterium]|nr:phenylalanine--tRNA ligase subunit alpha [Bacillota bacterium]
LLKEAKDEIEKDLTLDKLIETKNAYLSKKGKLSVLMSKMKELSNEEKRVFGKQLNDAKNYVENSINAKIKVLEEEKLNAKLKEETIDITLPGNSLSSGFENPFYKIIDEIEEIFIGMGYTVEKGPEVDKDHYVFELLNIPKDHPARDMQDTLYIDNETLLRSHTSAVQAHVMEKAKGKPIKIICPGKTYRRDDDDMTHSHQFAQVEGLVIDKNINLGNLKATLELFAKKMFSKDSKIRFRSSYFPFTEPSVEVDVSCFACHGKGCKICKGSGWIEILGAGMVHPNVLKMSGYDPDIYSGFAFGIGIERVAMLRYGIDDIRKFYQNDIRFIEEFNKKVED